MSNPAIIVLLDNDLGMLRATGQSDIPMSVRADKSGAVNFLGKPVP